MHVLHGQNGHLILIQSWTDPVRLSADLAGPVPLGPTAPAVNGVRRIPVPRSMRESIYLPHNIEEAHGMVTNAPGSAQKITARVPQLPVKGQPQQ